MARTERSSRIRLGSALGTPVYLERSWFLVAVVVTVLVLPTVQSAVPGLGGGQALLAAGSFALLLLGSVFLHELAHAVAARAAGTPPTDIVLDLWGGHTAFIREIPTAGRSILVAAVGPLTNGVLAAAALALRGAVPADGVVEMLVVLLAYSNGFVAVLNALPGLPLDGGRVLEGLVWAATRSRTTGTVVAGRLGQVVAVGLVVWFVVRPYALGEPLSLVSLVWVGAVAWMLWQGATSAIRYAAWRRAAAGVVAGRLMTPAVPLPATASVADARALLSRAAEDGAAPLLVVLDPYARPAAVLDAAALAAVPSERAGLVPASAAARGLPPVQLDADLAGDELLSRLDATPAPEYPVVHGGRVVGVLSRQAVVAAVTGR